MKKYEWIKQEAKEIKKVISQSVGKSLHVSKEDIVFTDVVPGVHCNNGGEYGFYTRYCPIPEYPGIYRIYTETTCDFDSCDTGYEGIEALTAEDYQELRKVSDEIEAAGSLY
jgi:hypothetical protein